MAIDIVKAQVNGTWHTLTKNASTGKYEATITAPSTTSFNKEGGYYNIAVSATNTAGTTQTVDAVTLAALRLVVKEKIKPVINITSPSTGAYVINSKQPVIFTVTDETNGSGVNKTSIVVKQDGTSVSSFTTETLPNGFKVTYTPATALSDGPHTVTIDAKDNDGNSAATKSTTYTIDTIPPTLNITSPAEGYISSKAALQVSGTTNDATSSPVTVNIKLNGTSQGAVTVGGDGTFSKSITLSEGSNTIVVTATDAAGKVSTVTRTVILDSSTPEIVSATITPNPADAGATVVISVEVTG